MGEPENIQNSNNITYMQVENSGSQKQNYFMNNTVMMSFRHTKSNLFSVKIYSEDKQ